MAFSPSRIVICCWSSAIFWIWAGLLEVRFCCFWEYSTEPTIDARAISEARRVLGGIFINGSYGGFEFDV